MHNGALKRLALALTFWLALHFSPLQAQLLGPYTSSSGAVFDVDNYGLLSDTGTFGGTTSLSLSGGGTRMFWYPARAAFRAGFIPSGGTEWNDGSIGSYSVAFGEGTTASATGSSASGLYAAATATGSTALGDYAYASGTYSSAMGGGTAATGIGSTAMGQGSTASGIAASALGYNSQATGNYSTSLGLNSSASGYCAGSVGTNIGATAEFSFVVGTYNLGGGSTVTWVPTDPLFEVGNGTSSTAKSDALIVYKNGTAKFLGAVQVPQSGDIPMYTGS